jgi:hypothetical protein
MNETKINGPIHICACIHSSAGNKAGVCLIQCCEISGYNGVEHEWQLSRLQARIVSPRWRSGWCACHCTQSSRVRSQPRRWIFNDDKNLQHTFPRMGSKVGDSMPKILRHVKNLLKSHRDGQIKFYIPAPILLLVAEISLLTGPPDSTGGCQSTLVDELDVSPNRYHQIIVDILITRR